MRVKRISNSTSGIEVNLKTMKVVLQPSNTFESKVFGETAINKIEGLAKFFKSYFEEVGLYMNSPKERKFTFLNQKVNLNGGFDSSELIHTVEYIFSYISERYIGEVNLGNIRISQNEIYFRLDNNRNLRLELDTLFILIERLFL